jgi:hypothetical protein
LIVNTGIVFTVSFLGTKSNANGLFPTFVFVFVFVLFATVAVFGSVKVVPGNIITGY